MAFLDGGRRLCTIVPLLVGAVAFPALSRPPRPHLSTSRPSAAPPAKSVVIVGATVIDVASGKHVPTPDILIVGNRIQALGALRDADIPKGTRVVDGHGLYVIPGLWDMHAHVDDHAPELYPRFIAYGVTGLREMAQRFPGGLDSFRVWQREVMAGTRVGPRVYGPSADLTYRVSIETPDDAVRIVDSLAKTGALFLKVHNDNMDPNLYFAVAREARRIGIPFVGHLPVGVTEVQASDSGQRSVEHVEENHHCWPNWPAPIDSPASPTCVAAAAAYVRNGTWMSPTVVGANYFPEHNPEQAQRFVRMMHSMGVPMLAGTDFVIEMLNTGIRPGHELLEDVVYLAGAMTPLEGLQAATLNPARFMKATDSLGTVAPHKLADLVLLAGDPTVDIHNIYKIRGVIANGRYFDSAEVDHLQHQPMEVVDTTHFTLTPDLLTHYIALKKDLLGFWQSQSQLYQEAKEGAHTVWISVIPPDVTAKGPESLPVTIFDYPAFAAKDTALAAVFRAHQLLPTQFQPIQVAVYKGVVRNELQRLLGAQYSDHLNTATSKDAHIEIENAALVQANRDALQGVGVTVQLPE